MCFITNENNEKKKKLHRYLLRSNIERRCILESIDKKKKKVTHTYTHSVEIAVEKRLLRNS